MLKRFINILWIILCILLVNMPVHHANAQQIAIDSIKINLDLVPTRQSDMKDWEILLSESQERMLVVVEKGKFPNLSCLTDV